MMMMMMMMMMMKKKKKKKKEKERKDLMLRKLQLNEICAVICMNPCVLCPTFLYYPVF
jgi:hypothetical protein